jgi:hypothetical protein
MIRGEVEVNYGRGFGRTARALADTLLAVRDGKDVMVVLPPGHAESPGRDRLAEMGATEAEVARVRFAGAVEAK